MSEQSAGINPNNPTYVGGCRGWFHMFLQYRFLRCVPMSSTGTWTCHEDREWRGGEHILASQALTCHLQPDLRPQWHHLSIVTQTSKGRVKKGGKEEENFFSRAGFYTPSNASILAWTNREGSQNVITTFRRDGTECSVNVKVPLLQLHKEWLLKWFLLATSQPDNYRLTVWPTHLSLMRSRW